MKHFIAFDLVVPRLCRFPKEITQKQRKSIKVSMLKLSMIKVEKERETNKTH